MQLFTLEQFKQLGFYGKKAYLRSQGALDKTIKQDLRSNDGVHAAYTHFLEKIGFLHC